MSLLVHILWNQIEMNEEWTHYEPHRRRWYPQEVESVGANLMSFVVSTSKILSCSFGCILHTNYILTEKISAAGSLQVAVLGQPLTTS